MRFFLIAAMVLGFTFIIGRAEAILLSAPVPACTSTNIVAGNMVLNGTACTVLPSANQLPPPLMQGF